LGYTPLPEQATVVYSSNGTGIGANAGNSESGKLCETC